MIKEIMHDPLFLAMRSETAAKEDVSVARDLLDTLQANAAQCVGMAGIAITRESA